MGEDFFQDSKARWAAASARSRSASVAWGSWPSTSSVAGLMTSWVRLPSPARNSPSIYSANCSYMPVVPCEMGGGVKCVRASLNQLVRQGRTSFARRTGANPCFPTLAPPRAGGHNEGTIGCPDPISTVQPVDKNPSSIYSRIFPLHRLAAPSHRSVVTGRRPSHLRQQPVSVALGPGGADPAIRAELLELLSERDHLPSFHEISPMSA